jgi:hypothetical protein
LGTVVGRKAGGYSHPRTLGKRLTVTRHAMMSTMYVALLAAAAEVVTNIEDRKWFYVKGRR